MATVTSPTRTRTKGVEGYEGEGPKWRLEHASSGMSVCQQAACKRAKSKIAKGELRIGTHTLFDRDGDNRWYMAWRHWACATKHQIEGLKGITEDDPAKAPGFDRLSSEAQEQVRLAFETGGVVDKEFKGISMDLAKVPKRYGGEILNATGYKVDVATRGTAACRNSDCPEGATKIAKGELRLGISVPFDGEHESWMYKHWKCVSKYDLEAVQAHHEEDSFDGIDVLSDDYKTVVMETLEKGEVIAPPKLESPPAKKPKKSKKKAEEDDSEAEAEAPKPKRKAKGKKKVEDADETDDAEETKPTPKSNAKGKKKTEDADETDGAEEPKTKPKPKTKSKAKGKKRRSEELDDDSEPEYVPKKTRSRAMPMEEVVDPSVARIQAMAEGLRTEAGK